MTETRFSEQLTKIRKERRWSQTKLAKMADVTPRTVQRAEAGEPVSDRTRQAFARALDLSIDQMALAIETAEAVAPAPVDHAPADGQQTAEAASPERRPEPRIVSLSDAMVLADAHEFADPSLITHLPEEDLGRAVLDISRGSGYRRWLNTNPSTRDEAEAIACLWDLLDEPWDWARSRPSPLGRGDVVRRAFDCEKRIERLVGIGYIVFGGYTEEASPARTSNVIYSNIAIIHAKDRNIVWLSFRRCYPILRNRLLTDEELAPYEILF